MKTIEQIKAERRVTVRPRKTHKVYLYTVLGAFLRERREEADLTQKEVGAAIGARNQSVMFWEKGKYLPDSQTLFRLSIFYGFSLDRLTPLFLEAGNEEE